MSDGRAPCRAANGGAARPTDHRLRDDLGYEHGTKASALPRRVAGERMAWFVALGGSGVWYAGEGPRGPAGMPHDAVESVT